MPNLHTDEKLLQALKDSARRELTSEELHRQRVSFIMGSVGRDSGITRAQVEQVLKSHEGRKAAG